VAKLLVAEGTADVKVNTPIAYLEGEGASSRVAGALTQRVGLVRPLSGANSATGTPQPHPDVVPTARREAQNSGGAAPAGTVIGRARLKGDHGQPQAGGGQGTVAPTVGIGLGQGQGQGQAKTRYIRAEGLEADPVAGWVVVVRGLGRGDFRPIYAGMNSVGRDPSQRISLNFGDESISREEHAFITYDEEQRCFYLQHGGKPNIIRLGSTPVLTPMQIQPYDLIRIGRTTLRFIPCCGPSFSWSDEIPD
jgi:hypothetical protein